LVNSILVTHPDADYNALFNTMVNTTEISIISEILGDNKRVFKKINYDKTMNMPTYLVAFVISDYETDLASMVSPQTELEIHPEIHPGIHPEIHPDIHPDVDADGCCNSCSLSSILTLF